MNLIRIKELVNTAHSCGILKLMIEGTSDGFFISGMSKKESIVLLHNSDENIGEFRLGVSDVKKMSDTLNLFDLEQSNIRSKNDGSDIESIYLVEGERDSLIKLDHYTEVGVPVSISDHNQLFTYKQSRKYHKKLIDMITSYKKATLFALKGQDNLVKLDIVQEDSTLTEIIGFDYGEIDFDVSFDRRSTLKLMKHHYKVKKKEKEMDMKLLDNGLIQFDIDGLSFYSVKRLKD